MQTKLPQTNLKTKHFFTIFTSIFNGEEYLHRVFESIEQQSFKDFEWIIINDGSTDNSTKQVFDFINIHPDIDVIYLEQENSGKHIAWNRAIQIASGKLFVPADADDYFFPHTLSFFYKKWIELTYEEQNIISGINVLCYDNETYRIVGQPFPHNYLKTNNLELEYKYRVKGEKWGCIRIDLLKKRLFPEVVNGHYPEDYLWLYLAKYYQVICFNEPLRRYYTSSQGIIQGSLKKKTVNNAKVIIQYNVWFLRNFGFYVLRYAPLEIVNKLKEVLSSFLVIMRLKR